MKKEILQFQVAVKLEILRMEGLYEYKCGYCETIFKQIVKFVGRKKSDHGGHNKIRCPRCNNFLKTKEFTKKIRDLEKGN